MNKLFEVVKSAVENSEVPNEVPRFLDFPVNGRDLRIHYEKLV